jgi:small subunit ribosomal protein S15
MALNAAETSQLIETYGKSAKDCGSAHAQVAILTTNIKKLTEHFKVHKKDNHSRRGLIHMINRRRKLLDYLKRTSRNEYLDLIQKLGLRR